MRTRVPFSIILATAIATLSPAAPCFAEDAFFEIPLSELKITAGKLPELEFDGKVGQFFTILDPSWGPMMPRVVLDGPGEGYADIPAFQTSWRFAQPQAETPHLVIRTSPGQVVTGRLIVAKGDGSGMTLIRFEVPATAAKESARRSFFSDQARSLRILAKPRFAWYSLVSSRCLRSYPGAVPWARTTQQRSPASR